MELRDFREGSAYCPVLILTGVNRSAHSGIRAARTPRLCGVAEESPGMSSIPRPGESSLNVANGFGRVRLHSADRGNRGPIRGGARSSSSSSNRVFPVPGVTLDDGNTGPRFCLAARRPSLGAVGRARLPEPRAERASNGRSRPRAHRGPGSILVPRRIRSASATVSRLGGARELRDSPPLKPSNSASAAARSPLIASPS